MTSSASPESRSGHGPLVEITNLTKWFAVKQSVFASVKGVVHAVEDVTLTVNRGETLGIVGESGCGKSTTARLMVKLLDATSGTVKFDGEDITNYSMRQMRPLRRQMQMIFQDPYSSLNPRKSVGQIIGEPFTIHKTEKDVRSRVQELLARVGLNPEHYNRYPHEFSGGQRQRIGVARAIALHPKLIVCDEPVSALDVSVQAQVLNLLKDLQRELRSLLSVHLPRPLGDAQVSRPGRRHVSRADRRVGAPSCFKSIRATRTPSRCCRRCRVRPRTGRCVRQRIILSGDVRRRSTRPRHACSIPGVRGSRTASATSTCPSCSRSAASPGRLSFPGRALAADRRGARPSIRQLDPEIGISLFR